MLHKNLASDNLPETNTSSTNCEHIQNPLSSTKFMLLQIETEILARQRRNFKMLFTPSKHIGEKGKKKRENEKKMTEQMIFKTLEENRTRLHTFFNISPEIDQLVIVKKENNTVAFKK